MWVSICLDWHFEKVASAAGGEWIEGARALGERHGSVDSGGGEEKWMDVTFCIQGIFSAVRPRASG